MIPHLRTHGAVLYPWQEKQESDRYQHADCYRGEVTTTALKHCLMVAGVHLKASELTAVDRAFRSISRPEMIAWKDFCKAAVDDMERSSPSGVVFDHVCSSMLSFRRRHVCLNVPRVGTSHVLRWVLRGSTSRQASSCLI